MSGSDKTEKPTPKRKREARRDGRIARTPELGVWASLLAATVLVRLTVSSAGGVLRELMGGVRAAIAQPDAATALRLFGHGMGGLVRVVAPLVLGLTVLGVLANVGQVGFAFSTKPLKPKASRLNPVAGFKRLASPQSLVQAGRELLKVVLLSGLAYRSLSGIVPHLLDSGRLSALELAGGTASAVSAFARDAALAGLVLAAADYALARRAVGKQTRMTKQEVRDEYRQSEGDPHVKGQIRARQRSISRLRMIAAVAGADAVVVNPTHVAVAIKYEAAKGAPRVVAKGAGAMAARIRAEADEHRVPMVQDVPLARTLYKACEVGQEIPAELFGAVAKLLAFLFALKARGPLPTNVHRVPA